MNDHGGWRNMQRCQRLHDKFFPSAGVVVRSLIAALLCLPLAAAFPQLAAAQVPDITIAAGAAATEGTAATFTVTASVAPTADLTVNLMVEDAPHSDFVAAGDQGTGKTVTILMGDATATYDVATDDDGADESNGPVTVTVETGNGYTVGSPGSASVAVSDNDPTTVTLSGAAGNLVEGDAKDIDLTLGRGLRQGETLTAPLTFAGAATRNSDYTLACPSSLPAGVTCSNLNTGAAQVAFAGPATGETAASVTIALTTTADNAAEATPETVEIGLGTLAPTGLGGGASGVDNLADFNISDPALPEANFAMASSSAAEDAGTHNVGVTLSFAPTATVTLDYTVGGTATSTADYAALTGSVDVASGTTSVNIPVTIIDDAASEGAETVELTLTAGGDYTVGATSVHTLTIQDNDPAVPEIAIAVKAGTPTVGVGRTHAQDTNVIWTPRVTEGTAASFTVTASPAPTADLTVKLTVADAPYADFVAGGHEGGKTVTIPTTGSATYDVATEDDSVDEPYGPVTVTVEMDNGYTVGSANSAFVLLADNDATTLTLSGPDGDLVEGSTKNITVTLNRGMRQDEILSTGITRSTGRGVGETMLAPIALGGTATPDEDYTISCPSTLPAGVTCRKTRIRTGCGPLPPGVTCNNPFVQADDVVWFRGTLAHSQTGGPTASTVNITVTAKADNVAEPAESVVLSLRKVEPDLKFLGGGATLVDNVADFNITDSSPVTPPPPVVPPPPPVTPPTATEATLSASPNPALEGETITVVAALSQALATDMTIPLALTAGTAEEGDYEPLASIAIKANQTSGTGDIVTKIDADADDETLTVTLGDLPGGVQPGSPSSVELTITEKNLIVSAEGEEEIPEAFALEQNYPNPFNPSTTIRFALDKAQRVRLAVYDLLGQEVRVLVDGVRPAARYDVAFDAADLASGTYLYVLRTESQVAVKTMSLLK